MNMFSTGNPEEDELLKLLRQGLITPEQLENMSAGQQAAQELRGGVSDTLTPMGSRRDTTVRAAASLQPETTATAQAPAQRASTPMESRSEGMKERSLTDMLKDRASTAAPMLDQRNKEDAQPRFVNTFVPRGYLPEEKADLSIRERARGRQDPKISMNATPVERGLLPGERAEEEEAPDESFDPSLGRYPEMPFPISETIVDAKRLGAEEDQQSLLSRIGSLIANNPEAVASGAQLIGGLVSNAAQNRAQRKADRTTDQRVARANLISAITGGRARPTVERAQADTGGFMSLDTLGKALQGGGAAVKGELARQVEEAERERKAGLDDRAASVAEQRAETQEQSRIDTDAYRDRLLTLKERGLRADALKSLRPGQPKETPDKQTRNEYKAMSRILRQVDNVEDLLRDAGFFQAGSGLKVLEIAGLDEGLPQFMGGEKTRELKASVNSLVQTLGEGLSGVLSDRDIEFLRQQAIKETDSLDTAMLKAQQIRNRLSQNIRENFEIDSQYFNMEPYRNLVDLVEASGEQGEGSFISDLSGAKLNLD